MKLSDGEIVFLKSLMCIIRLIFAIPLIVVCYFYVGIMWSLGTKNTLDKTIKYWESLIFNIK